MENLLHLRAPGNWMNDPNGFIYYQGKYHLFFQYFPYAPEWGTMHWGHGVSEDLVHWKHLGLALFPTKQYDRNGVFSGSALEKDGKLYLYYSAVRYLETDDEDIHRAKNDNYETSQAVVISGDGFHFDNWKDKRQIIPVITDTEIGDPADTRDPKVWFEDGRYYMILGSVYDRKGRVVFFESQDGENWKYANQCRHETFGRTMECPDLFWIGEHCVFLGSPMGISEDGKEYANHALCALAHFDKKSCELEIAGDFQYVDYGMDLYAPQTNVDKEGRRILIGWMRMPKTVEEEGKTPWNGMMSLPRMVEVEEGHVYFRIPPQVEEYFVRETEDRHCLKTGKAYRIQTVLEEGERLEIGGYQIWVEDGYVKTDRSQVYKGIEGYRTTAATPKSLENHRLDIFVDANLIEVFVNEGEYVISHVVYDLGNEVNGKVLRVLEGK